MTCLGSLWTRVVFGMQWSCLGLQDGPRRVTKALIPLNVTSFTQLRGQYLRIMQTRTGNGDRVGYSSDQSSDTETPHVILTWAVTLELPSYRNTTKKG